MYGFLNLNKPAGLTSHDCVARVRRLLQMKKVGHGGTLDPSATGVLPIAFGHATRLLQFLPSDKAYDATIRFGIKTTTDDLEGDILQALPASHLTLTAVETLLPQFCGTIQQIPPAYSAIQVQGKRLYELARTGARVEVPVRTVTIYQMRVLEWRSQTYPELDIAIDCGTGTYIRAIARDLGDALQTGGTLAALKRTMSSGFQLAESLTLADLEDQIQSDRFQPIPPEQALSHLPPVTLRPDEAQRWCQGQRLERQAIAAPGEPLRIQDETHRFLGIGQVVQTSAASLLIPKLVFKP